MRGLRHLFVAGHHAPPAGTQTGSGVSSRRLAKRSRALRGRHPARDSQADGAPKARAPFPRLGYGASLFSLGTPEPCLTKSRGLGHSPSLQLSTHEFCRRARKRGQLAPKQANHDWRFGGGAWPGRGARTVRGADSGGAVTLGLCLGHRTSVLGHGPARTGTSLSRQQGLRINTARAGPLAARWRRRREGTRPAMDSTPKRDTPCVGRSEPLAPECA